MTKRVASTEMTKDNWMVEDEPEEAGLFEQASNNKLQNRNIRKAKRRLPENSVPSSPFSQFAGFMGSKSPSLSTLDSSMKLPTSNGSNSVLNSGPKSENLNSPKFLPKTNPAFQIQVTNSVKDSSEHSRMNKNSNGKPENVHLEDLKQLNLAFLSWIKEHMSKNAFCDFTPVCMDYIEHIKKLEKPLNAVNEKVVSSEGSSTPNAHSPKMFDTICKDHLKSSQTPLARSVDFNLTRKGAHDLGSSPPKPFTFSAKATSNSAPEKREDDEDGDQNYVPPKNDFQAVKEDNAVYSRRCKLFFKKQGDFVDKGCGTLHLKKLDGKMQLLIRADTVLGNILLNIILTADLPTQRLGKNNVMIVCIPNPPLDPKSAPEPTPLLIRVKTADDANKLLETLNKYKCSDQC